MSSILARIPSILQAIRAILGLIPLILRGFWPVVIQHSELDCRLGAASQFAG
jgi:hypothetical protein